MNNVLSDQCFGIKNEPEAKWKEVSKVPKFLYDSAKATIGNTAYFVGGFEETPVDYVYSYNGDLNTWKKESSLRFNRMSSTLVSTRFSS